MGYDFKNQNDTGLPLELILALKTGFHVPYFVETGTASGMSIRRASTHFKHCHSIEIVEGRTPLQRELVVQDEADPTIVEYFKVTIFFRDNIVLHTGDTAKLLPSIVEEVGDNYCVYWLDAHYSDPEIPSDDLVECPVLDEIVAIRHNQKAIIVIDDARLFFGEPPEPHNPEKWCDFKQMYECLNANFPNHYITVFDDFILAIPDEMKANYNNYWKETYKERYK